MPTWVAVEFSAWVLTIQTPPVHWRLSNLPPPAASPQTYSVWATGRDEGVTHTLKLGSVANTINANTIAVGSSSGRGNGDLSFETGTGTLLLRAADGIAAVTTMNMVNNGFGHNGTHTAVVDFTGHSVDAKIGALTMARRTGTGSAGSNSTLTFDTGTLEVASVNMAVATNALMTGNNNATINIGGGTATFGAISMATNSGGGGTTAALNLTGGTTTVTGDIPVRWHRCRDHRRHPRAQWCLHRPGHDGQKHHQPNQHHLHQRPPQEPRHRQHRHDPGRQRFPRLRSSRGNLGHRSKVPSPARAWASPSRARAT